MNEGRRGVCPAWLVSSEVDKCRVLLEGTVAGHFLDSD